MQVLNMFSLSLSTVYYWRLLISISVSWTSVLTTHSLLLMKTLPVNKVLEGVIK